MSLQESLENIRARKTSKIPAQAQQATLLNAVEASLKEDNAKLSPASYFSALVGLLDHADSSAELSCIYLLQVVIPHVSQSLLASTLDHLVSKVAHRLTASDADTSCVRSCIAVLEGLLVHQPKTSWTPTADSLGAWQTFKGILALCSDTRPKIRKRAVEAVERILSGDSVSVVRSTTADFALELAGDNDSDAKTMHALQLVKVVAQAGWPSSKVDELCQKLLDLSRSSSSFVVSAVFEVFDLVLQGLDSFELLEPVLELLVSLAPAKSDKQLAPVWFAAIVRGFERAVELDTVKAASKLTKLWDLASGYLDADAPSVVESASQCLVALVVSLFEDPEYSMSAEDLISDIAKRLFDLLSVRFHAAFTEICAVFVAFIDILRWLAPVDDSVRVIGVLRDAQKSQEQRQAADSVLAAAIRGLGPEKVLELVPLQLSLKGQDSGASGRAWMLPLLRDNIQQTNLSHFISYIVPLATSFDQAIGNMTKEANIKVVSIVRDQLWALFPRYCDLPLDLRSSLSNEFVQQLVSSLYERPEYRNLVCQGLRLLVESNSVYALGVAEDKLLESRLTPKDAEKNVSHMRKLAPDLISVLLNIYSSVQGDHSALLLETVSAFISILKPTQVRDIFNNISNVIAESLKNGNERTLTDMLDVVSICVPFLPSESGASLFEMFKVVAPLEKHPLAQKKIYGAFANFADTDTGREAILDKIDVVTSTLVEFSSSVQPPARRTRLQLFVAIVEILPDDSLHFVPCILSEVILAIKDINEKTRQLAFTLLVSMGDRLIQGGSIDHSKIQDLDDDAVVEANLSEYFTMAIAGLLGSTPHMVSASVTAIAYIFYHYRDALLLEQKKEVVETVWTFLNSSNREIVKGVLGFVKVSILVLDAEDLEPHLSELLRQLMGWSTEHKNHFKSKVKHIIERLLRKFGYEKVAASFPESDIKFLQNIHKSKERARRKKKNGEVAPGPEKSRKFESEFDQVLYGSDDSEDEEEPSAPKAKAPTKGKKDHGSQQYIINEDEPLDLLGSSALSHISSSKPQAQNRKVLRHKLAEKDGRIIVGQEANEEEDNDEKSALSAYVDAVRNGPVRTQRGKLKYKRGKRAQPEEDEDDGDEDLKGNYKRKVVKPKGRLPKRRKF